MRWSAADRSPAFDTQEEDTLSDLETTPDPWSALAPQFPHVSGDVVFGGLLVFKVVFLWLGLGQFRKKAIG